MLYTKENFYTLCNVSRETLAGLQMYHDLLVKWRKSINLVAPSTLETLWHRHFADSAQLYKVLPDTSESIVDIGSGGGFPAVVCAILAKCDSVGKPLHFTMIDSNRKKCIFLQECIRLLRLNATVIQSRVEECTSNAYSVLTARALTSLPVLVEWAYRLQVPKIFLLKGKKWHTEMQECEKVWDITYKKYESVTEKGAKIIFIEKYKKKVCT